MRFPLHCGDFSADDGRLHVARLLVRAGALANAQNKCARAIAAQALGERQYLLARVLLHHQLQPLVLVHEHRAQLPGVCARAFEVFPAGHLSQTKLKSYCA
jgi:hypothetical protein